MYIIIQYIQYNTKTELKSAVSIILYAIHMVD